MKIVLAWIAQFVGHNGGMDKVFVHFANEMVSRGHSVTLLYCTEHTGKIYTTIDKRVNVANLVHWTKDRKWESVEKSHTMKLMRELTRLFSKEKMKELKNWIVERQLGTAICAFLKQTRPDVVIAMDGRTAAPFINRCEYFHIPVVTMSHFNAPYIWNDSSKRERLALSKSACLQVLMPSDVAFFYKYLPEAHVIHIPNVVPQYKIMDRSNPTAPYKIVNVARLDMNTKRQHLLIKAFAEIGQAFPDWKLELWGEEQGGIKYTKQLKGLIAKYHMESQIQLCGNTNDVLSVYQSAEIFAFPSAYEGFPLAMTEAMSAGLPVIAYKTCPAVNELVQSGENGVLVDDGVEPLAEGLKQLMSRSEWRKRLGENAHQSMKRYSAVTIWNMWERTLLTAISEQK